ncbi:hypothetical protein U9M48_026239 [Paspalum notatum var. saurae]|uniref:DUF1618 domain-containing protein n=1 Tax=Paspalum notatum var. saurae TaxID=547442 RepID=A0AAQ3TUW3_PASNO
MRRTWAAGYASSPASLEGIGIGRAARAHDESKIIDRLPPNPGMAAAAQEPWAILAAIPTVVKYKYADRVFPPGADISVARKDPPRASVLRVPPHVSLPACLGCHPYVAAADTSGLLLVFGTHPVDGESAILNYHVCDARTGEVASLPRQSRPMGFYGANVGLIVKPGGGGGVCMVAELLRSPGGGATLLSYKVGERGEWRERELMTCSPPLPEDWYPDGVVSYGGMLWWVDLSFGLLACDPFAEDPALLHVPLPQAPDALPPDDQPNRGAHRCMKVSGGRLRCVQIHGKRSVPVVSTWGLAGPTSSPISEWEWNPERSVPLAELWVDDCVDLRPPNDPALALIHPTDPDRVYFFLRSSIVAVDLRLRKLVGAGHEFEMLAPPRELRRMRSSHFVHAWQYDPSSTRPDFVSKCMRQEKAIAANTNNWFYGIFPVTRKTVKEFERIWEFVINREEEDRRRRRQQQQQDFKRWRLVSEKRKKKQSTFMNDIGYNIPCMICLPH